MEKRKTKKEIKIRELTWHYFWRYKLVEIDAFLILGIIVYNTYAYTEEISAWLMKHGDLIAGIFGVFIISIFLLAMLAWWIVANWDAAENKAKEVMEKK